MGAPENRVRNRILAGLSRASERLFRINAGMGWAGTVIPREKLRRDPAKLKAAISAVLSGKAMILMFPRPLHGAPTGWPDLFGWRTVEITPEMVGQKIAVAWGKEIKAGGSEKNLTPEQRNFGRTLEAMGGVFEVET